MNWTIESEITVVIMAIFALIILIALAGVWFVACTEGHYFAGVMWTVGLALLSGLIGFAFWWGMYPWKAEYHSWRPVGGVVSSVDSRFMADGAGGVEQKFVVMFVGDPVQYGVIDTRAAAIKVGDHLDISCVRRWQQTGSHGYDCGLTDLRKGG